ncbi:MAG: DNA replication and repair protein RecF [Magnetococcales bacterium]|nr:DNA replication and repair protein RecF [Magnetococcales bacterium]
MVLEQLALHDFRNIANARLAFGPGLNLVVGGNGQGKSNLLEAVGLLASGRSFRRATPTVMRRHGQPWYKLAARIHALGMEHRLEFFAEGRRQAARLDGKPLTSAAGLGAWMGAVIFTPASLRLVQGEPGERRRWLDWTAFALDPRYAALMRDFQKALASRNRLLQRGGGSAAELDAWESRLAPLGAEATAARRSALAAVTHHLGPLLTELGLGGLELTARLDSGLLRVGGEDGGADELDAAALSERYARRLRENRDRDRREGSTSLGPHRDDVALTMGGRPLVQVGSQGQQKRLALALKLAEGALNLERRGEPPLYILDDPASELDREGVERFLDLLSRVGRQVLAAACAEGEIPWSGERRVWRVTEGAFLPVEPAAGG